MTSKNVLSIFLSTNVRKFGFHTNPSFISKAASGDQTISVNKTGPNRTNYSMADM